MCVFQVNDKIKVRLYTRIPPPPPHQLTWNLTGGNDTCLPGPPPVRFHFQLVAGYFSVEPPCHFELAQLRPPCQRPAATRRILSAQEGRTGGHTKNHTFRLCFMSQSFLGCVLKFHRKQPKPSVHNHDCQMKSDPQPTTAESKLR